MKSTPALVIRMPTAAGLRAPPIISGPLPTKTWRLVALNLPPVMWKSPWISTRSLKLNSRPSAENSTYGVEASVALPTSTVTVVPLTTMLSLYGVVIVLTLTLMVAPRLNPVVAPATLPDSTAAMPPEVPGTTTSRPEMSLTPGLEPLTAIDPLAMPIRSTERPPLVRADSKYRSARSVTPPAPPIVTVVPVAVARTNGPAGRSRAMVWPSTVVVSFTGFATVLNCTASWVLASKPSVEASDGLSPMVPLSWPATPPGVSSSTPVPPVTFTVLSPEPSVSPRCEKPILTTLLPPAVVACSRENTPLRCWSRTTTSTGLPAVPASIRR